MSKTLNMTARKRELPPGTKPTTTTTATTSNLTMAHVTSTVAAHNLVSGTVDSQAPSQQQTAGTTVSSTSQVLTSTTTIPEVWNMRHMTSKWLI